MSRLGFLSAVLLGAACTTSVPDKGGVGFIEVTLLTPAAEARGSEQAPLDAPRGDFAIKVEVRVLDREGLAMDCLDGRQCYTGEVSFGVSPGWIPVEHPTELDSPPVPARRGQEKVVVKNGTGVAEFTVRGVFARTHVWAEEWTTVIGGEQRESSFVAGLSEPIYFKFPTIQDLQYDPTTMAPNCLDNRSCSSASSPLVDNFVEARSSTYLVTGITNEGFFITDLEEDTSPPIGTYPGAFNSMFMFNFSYPDNLGVGDIVTRVFGTVQEFTGDTQLTFPTWDKQSEVTTLQQGYTRVCQSSSDCPDDRFECTGGACRLVPVPLTEAICAINLSVGNNANLCGDSNRNIDLESLESARLEITEAYMPTAFANCDFNGDGAVRNTRLGSCDADEECECKLACIKQEGCTELSTLNVFGQYAVTIAGPAKYKMNIVSRDVAPTVHPNQPSVDDPTAQRLIYGNVKVRVRGNLRQTLPARPKWIIVAAERADFCCLETDPLKCRDIPVCKD